MSSWLNTVATKFYDPLYEVVVFSTTKETEGQRSFWQVGVADHNAVTVPEFLKIIDSYEFSRLNFLKQAGLAWLVFPSATHSRFSHSLGCWLLSEWASDNVFVRNSESSGQPERLGKCLQEIRWLEAFQVALLLHDIGHFPFSHVIENNDILRERYASQAETKGIELNHESIGLELILGTGPVFKIFHKYTAERLGQDIEPERFLSARLRNCRVQPEKVAYLISGEQGWSKPDLSLRQTSFVQGVHELISGVVDLDRLDHYHRDAHFISIGIGEFNIHGLLHNMALVYEKPKQKEGSETHDGEVGKTHVQLFGDGVEHAFQMLYAKKTLTQSVFHHQANLAYEVMLNFAINQHWNEADESFRLFLPFYDDSELMVALMHSKSDRVRKVTEHIRLRNPFRCAGKFFLSESAYNQLGCTRAERRAAFLDKFKSRAMARNLHEDQCFLRLDKEFGKADAETEWMDLREIRGEKGQPLADSEDHKTFVEFIRQKSWLSARTFWLFVSDPTLVDSAETIGKDLGMNLV
jgi:HD superfamily phosphohydrolase